MQFLARVVVSAFVFLDFCDDETLDPDDAVKMMESLSFELQGCSEEEKNALDAVCRERIKQINSGKIAIAKEEIAEKIEYYENFVANLNLNGSEDE